MHTALSHDFRISLSRTCMRWNRISLHFSSQDHKDKIKIYLVQFLTKAHLDSFLCFHINFKHPLLTIKFYLVSMMTRMVKTLSSFYHAPHRISHNPLHTTVKLNKSFCQCNSDAKVDNRLIVTMRFLKEYPVIFHLHTWTDYCFKYIVRYL